MKKLLLFFISVLCFAESKGQGFDVNKAQIDIYISEAGYFDVVEIYELTFNTYKHGIYRDIQTNYDLLTSEGEKEKRKIKIKKIAVPGHKCESDP